MSRRLLLPDILVKSYSELFWKIPKKKPLKKSCFHNDGGSRPETFLKHNHTVLKQVTYVTYMLQIISLTGTIHQPIHQLNVIYSFPKLFYLLSFNYWLQNYKLFFSKGEPHPQACQTSKIEHFVKIVNGF